jgi:hypothetical protein
MYIHTHTYKLTNAQTLAGILHDDDEQNSLLIMVLVFIQFKKILERKLY